VTPRDARSCAAALPGWRRGASPRSARVWHLPRHAI